MTKPFNEILARYPEAEGSPVLWHLPGEGVYMTHSGSVSFVRICSKSDFDRNRHVLINQGWILETN